MPAHELGNDSADATAADSVEQVEPSDFGHMAWVAHVLTCCEGPASFGFASRVSDKAAGPVRFASRHLQCRIGVLHVQRACSIASHKDLCCESLERCELRMLAGVQAPVAASGCAACASQQMAHCSLQVCTFLARALHHLTEVQDMASLRSELVNPGDAHKDSWRGIISNSAFFVGSAWHLTSPTRVGAAKPEFCPEPRTNLVLWTNCCDCHYNCRLR